MSSSTRETAPGESALARWSRRKLEAEQTPAVDAGLLDQQPAATADAQVDSAVEAPAALTDADMQDIDTLTDDSDFTPFMSSGVSEELRNLALRKLFHAPVFNIRDGLDEYDEDYTTFEKLGDIITSDMKHQIEMQQQRMRAALQQENDAEALQIAELEDEAKVEDEDSEAMHETASPEVTGIDDVDAESGSKV
jgi:cell division protein FtsB